MQSLYVTVINKVYFCTQTLNIFKCKEVPCVAHPHQQQNAGPLNATPENSSQVLDKLLKSGHVLTRALTMFSTWTYLKSTFNCV